ncbi:hypothetical protein OZX56_00420 [Lactobacillus sp. ESL0684]|uniref:hypothetical protein n=1 Tax=unclassified Lactobacillus TaxID=2620435 RepID=UPI0023F75A3E|nr:MULTISPECIES: hypothetical protein [unclassified Lactobacillus]WEV41235.1 hypothetical protein OZX59_05800 [Lactobacillus sp. ESL0681]WEV44478.1 hypothetical protein OZX56_00420 [Lactobacillus sp. ESL0684]
MIGMKFKHKIGDTLLFLGTGAAFILSIVLWIFIMTNDQYFSHIKQDNNVTQQSRMHKTQSVNDLYIPTSSYGYQDGQLCRLYDAKNNLPLEFTKELKGAKYQQVKKVSSSQLKYEQLLKDPDYLQLTFPDEVNLNLLTKRNLQKTGQQFRRVFVSSSNKYLYLGNDETYTVLKLELANVNFKRLRGYAKQARSKIPVKFEHLKGCYEVFYLNNEDWRVYSYLTNSQTDSYFVSRLLGTTNVTTHTGKGPWTIYSLNYYTKLRVPKTKSNRHDFLYTNYEKRKNMTVNEQLLDSVDYVHKTGLNEQDLRFFDTNGAITNYTNYVEGIPVFLNKHDLQINTNYSQDAVEVTFNNLELQIPIPFDGQTRNLQSTDSVVQNLVNSGLKRTEIQRVVVAFQVEKDNSHDNLVNLIPTYYVKAYDQWKSLSEWKKQDFSVLDRVGKKQGGTQ